MNDTFQNERHDLAIQEQIQFEKDMEEFEELSLDRDDKEEDK